MLKRNYFRQNKISRTKLKMKMRIVKNKNYNNKKINVGFLLKLVNKRYWKYTCFHIYFGFVDSVVSLILRMKTRGLCNGGFK